MRHVSDVGAHWLAASSGRPAGLVWHDWLHQTWAVLPVGRGWDVVAVPQRRVTGATRVRPEAWVGVPLLADLGTGYAYVWVPAGTAGRWDVTGTVALGEPWCIPVPRPGGPQVPEQRWVTAPGRRPVLMDAAVLREALLAVPAGDHGREDSL